MSLLKLKLNSYKEVFTLLQSVDKYFVPIDIIQGDRDLAVCRYKHGNLRSVDVTISLPKVEDYDSEDPFTIQVIKGVPRRGIITEMIQSRRISRKTIWNSNIYHIDSKMSVDECLDTIESGKWFLHNFYFFFYDALFKACESLEKMSTYKLNAGIVQSCFSSNISNLLARLELVKSDTHIAAHHNSIELGYIGMDQTQGDLQTKISSDIQQAIKNRFLRVAVENECDLVYTSKNHPGRVIGHAYNELFDQYCMFPNIVTQKRVGREAFSSLSGCIMFGNNKFGEPLVYNDLGKPQVAMSANTIKFVNCAFASFTEMVPMVDGKPLNADAVLGTAWITCTEKHLFGTREEETDQRPFEEGIEIPDFEARYPEAKQAKTTVIQNPMGGAYEQKFSTQLLVEENCDMSWKAATESAIKGMVLPSNLFLLEKRPNEDFYRPIFLVFSADSLIKKQATNSILRMLISRTQNTSQQVPHDVTRENFIEYKDEIMDRLINKGDTGKSQLYKFIPKVNVEEIPIYHFKYTDQWIVDENSIGFIPGIVIPILDSEDEIAEAYTGEVSVMRMATDSNYGNSERNNNLGIKRDTLVRAGGLFTDNIPHQEDVEIINSLAQVYKSV